MTLHHKSVTALIVVFCAATRANTPPPQLPIEEQICTATHVFIGTASNVRFVNTSRVPMCANEPPIANGGLTFCGSAEVDIAVSEVLFPSDWAPKGNVVYRFGGGLFSTVGLQQDLEGQAYLFHAKLDPTGGGNIFVPSAPWVLGKSPKDIDEVKRLLINCKRP